MDSILRDSLDELENHNKEVSRLRTIFKGLKSLEKTSESRLFLRSIEKTIEAKKASVWASNEWEAYIIKMNQAECEYLDALDTQELLKLRHTSEYLTYKVENGLINRQ